MTQVSHISSAVFWLMVLLGSALLAPCVILPAWLEYQASLDLKAWREYQVAQRQAEVTKLRKQREHLESDDAYLLRIAQEDLNLQPPEGQPIQIDPGPPEPPAPPLRAESRDTELVPELSAMVEQLMVRHPIVQMFVRPETRPPLMIIGGGLLLAAIVLLGVPRPAPSNDPPPASYH